MGEQVVGSGGSRGRSADGRHPPARRPPAQPPAGTLAAARPTLRQLVLSHGIQGTLQDPLPSTTALRAGFSLD
jgi:hypothetical protein